MPRIRLIIVIGAAMLLAACSGHAASDATDAPTTVPITGSPTQTATATIEATDTETIAATQAVTEAVTTVPTATDESASEPTTAVGDVGKRDAPVPVDAGFHNDAATVFAATGNPQLIEVFTFW